MHETGNTGRLLYGGSLLNPAEETDPGNHLVPMNVALLEGTCTKLTISKVAMLDLNGGEHATAPEGHKAGSGCSRASDTDRGLSRAENRGSLSGCRRRSRYGTEVEEQGTTDGMRTQEMWI